jgi:hypothetical protein
MFKLEHNEAIVLIQIIEANSFQGKDLEMMAKLMGKIKREAQKTAPAKDIDVTEAEGWVDNEQAGTF